MNSSVVLHWTEKKYLLQPLGSAVDFKQALLIQGVLSTTWVKWLFNAKQKPTADRT